MIYSSSNLKTPSKLCSGSKSHDVQEVLKKKQVTASVLLSFKRKGSIEFFFFFLINLFIFYLFIFGCVGSSLLCVGFLWLWRVGAALRCGVRASHCGGFSLWSTGSRHAGFSSCGMRASVVVVCGLSSCGSRALERRLSSCGTRA